MSIIMNPGAEWHPSHSSPEQAAQNIEALLVDLGGGDATPLVDLTEEQERLSMGGTRYQSDHDGRYPFCVHVNDTYHLIEMPGLPLDEVRFVDDPGQDIFDFPRLFIDGSSWIWVIALSVLTDATTDYGRESQ